MSLTLDFAATLTLKLNEDMRPAPLPIAFSLTYTKNAMHDGSTTGAVTNQAIPQGSVTAPKFVLVQVLSGTVSFSWDSAGAGVEVLTAGETGVPATKIMARSNATAAQLYITTTGPASYRVWMYQ